MSTDSLNSAEDSTDNTPDHPDVEEVVSRLRKVWSSSTSKEKRSTFDVTGQTVGNYTIQQIVGHGAFGVVYRARDEQLGRDVALKVPRPEVLLDESKLRRFEKEAATAAMLEHPSIIPIYEADLTGPKPYIATAYCKGPDLGEWLANRETPIPTEQAVQFVIKLADAVHYAHERGVLHRDLKPSNVLLEFSDVATPLTTETDKTDDNHTKHIEDTTPGEKGTDLSDYEPRLTDFGLSKFTENDPDETRSSQTLGTPSYMAPEQINPSIGGQSASIDIHGLGTVLYELLVGKPPFIRDNVAATLLALQQDDAVFPRGALPLFSRDLEAICLKCLEKRPARRYATAEELSKDLRRYASGEPTKARPLGPMGRSTKWIDRNRLASAFVTVLVVSMATLAGQAVWHADRIAMELEVNQGLRKSAESREAEAQRSRYLGEMRLINQMLQEGRIAPARKRLRSYIPPSPNAAERDFPWNYLWERSSEVKKTFTGHRALVRSVAHAPQAGLVISGGDDKTVRFYNQNTEKEVSRLSQFTGNVNAVAITPDEQELITGVDAGELIVWDISEAADGKEPTKIDELDSHSNDILCLAVSSNGKHLASAGAGGDVLIWDLSTRTLLHRLKGHIDWVRELDFSPDGETLASVSHDDFVILWNVAEGIESGRVRITEGHRLGLSVRFHPSGKFIAAGNSDGHVQIIRLEDLATVWSFNVHFAWIRSIDFSEDGKAIAIAGTDPFIRLFRLGPGMQGTSWQTIRGNGRETWCVEFLNEGHSLLSSGLNGKIMLRQLSARSGPTQKLPSEVAIELKLREEIISRRFGTSYDREFILLSGYRGAWLVDTKNYPKRRSLTYSEQLVTGGTVSPDGDWVAAITWPSISIWNTRGSEDDYAYRRDSRGWQFTAVAFNPASNAIVVGTDHGELRILDFPAMQEITRLQPFGKTRVSDVLFTPDGQYLAACFCGVWDRVPETVVLWDAKSLQEIARINGVIRLLAISPDSHLLALVGSQQKILLWDIRKNQELHSLDGHLKRTLSGDFSPDGKYLATTAGTGPINLWSTKTGQLVLEIDHGLQFPQFVFGPDGSAFATDLRLLTYHPKINYRHHMIRLLPGED